MDEAGTFGLGLGVDPENDPHGLAPIGALITSAISPPRRAPA